MFCFSLSYSIPSFILRLKKFIFYSGFHSADYCHDVQLEFCRIKGFCEFQAAVPLVASKKVKVMAKIIENTKQLLVLLIIIVYYATRAA